MKDIALMFLYISKIIINLVNIIISSSFILLIIFGGEIKIHIGKNKENKENNNG